MTLVVISPHLDDAVLSCGGAIYAAIREARPVVITVFSGGASQALRREEDLSALAFLGADALHLGLLDAPERRALARTHRSLVEDAHVEASDVNTVREAIQTSLGRLRPSRVYAPLGVGCHIDHRVVFEALGSLEGITYYEDRPYAFLPGATRARMASLGWRLPRALAAKPAEEHVAAAFGTLPHLASYAHAPSARKWLRAHLQANESALSQTPEPHVDVSAFDDVTATAVCRAIAMYTSQLYDLFGSYAGLVSTLRSAASNYTGSAHIEQTFTLRPNNRKDANASSR